MTPNRRLLMLGGLALGLMPFEANARRLSLAQEPSRDFTDVRFNIAQGRAVRHRPKVAVASYGVSYFYTGRTQTMNSDGGALVNTALYGVSPAMMAEVAEAGCQDLRARLAAAGETVVSAEETRAAVAAAGTSMREGNVNSGQGTFDGVTVAQRWMTVGSQTAPMVTGYSGEANSMIAGLQTRNRLATASAQLDAIMLTPVIWIDYAEMGRSRTRVEGRAAIGVRGSPSGFIASAADARGRLVMATLIPTENHYSDRPYLADIRSQDGTSDLQALANVNARDARILANPLLWTDIATDALRGYNTGLTNAIREIRSS
jgi:hypothetical protein